VVANEKETAMGIIGTIIGIILVILILQALF